MDFKSLIIFLTAILCCSCLKTFKSINLNNISGEIPNSEFISRFSLPYHSSLSSTFKVKLVEPYNSDQNFPLSFLFFDDDEWNEVIRTKDCERSKQLARYEHKVYLRSDGEWSNLESYSIPSISKNQVWYVVVSDCSGFTHQSNPNMSKIEVELHMLNSGSEFSHEEYGVLTLNIILLLIYLYFLASTTYSLAITAMNKDDIDQLKVGCIFAIYMELLHIGSQTVHLIVYSYNGHGFYILDVISTVLQMNSQIIVVCLFILIAYGWEITDTDLSKSSIKYIILGGTIIALHTLVAYLTAFDDGEHHKYHDYGGFQGFAIIVIRIGLYITFIYGIVQTYERVPNKTQRFLKALSVAGTLYMLTFPTLWMLSFIITAHLRNRLIVYGNLGLQLFAIIIMQNQISKKGTKLKEAVAKSRDILNGKNM